MSRFLCLVLVAILTLPASGAPFAKLRSQTRRAPSQTGRTRIRDRLDDLESQADHTMSDARQLLDALQRGVDVELRKTGTKGLLDFLTGPPGTVFPFSIEIHPLGFRRLPATDADETGAPSLSPVEVFALPANVLTSPRRWFPPDLPGGGPGLDLPTGPGQPLSNP